MSILILVLLLTSFFQYTSQWSSCTSGDHKCLSFKNIMTTVTLKEETFDARPVIPQTYTQPPMRNVEMDAQTEEELAKTFMFYLILVILTFTMIILYSEAMDPGSVARAYILDKYGDSRPNGEQVERLRMVIVMYEYGIHNDNIDWILVKKLAQFRWSVLTLINKMNLLYQEDILLTGKKIYLTNPVKRKMIKWNRSAYESLMFLANVNHSYVHGGNTYIMDKCTEHDEATYCEHNIGNNFAEKVSDHEEELVVEQKTDDSQETTPLAPYFGTGAFTILEQKNCGTQKLKKITKKVNNDMTQNLIEKLIQNTSVDEDIIEPICEEIQDDLEEHYQTPCDDSMKSDQQSTNFTVRRKRSRGKVKPRRVKEKIKRIKMTRDYHQQKGFGNSAGKVGKKKSGKDKNIPQVPLIETESAIQRRQYEIEENIECNAIEKEKVIQDAQTFMNKWNSMDVTTDAVWKINGNYLYIIPPSLFQANIKAIRINPEYMMNFIVSLDEFNSHIGIVNCFFDTVPY